MTCIFCDTVHQAVMNYGDGKILCFPCINFIKNFTILAPNPFQTIEQED
jgi:hypothetical protein